MCCFLPDGRVAYASQLSPGTDRATFDSAGVEIDVVRPLEEIGLSFRGALVIPDEPRDCGAWTSSDGVAPVRAEVDMNFHAAAPVYVGRRHGRLQGDAKGTGNGSYQQFVTVIGQMRVGDELWLVEGHGLRSHTWGSTGRPPLFERRMTASAGPTFGFALWWESDSLGSDDLDGFLWDGTSLHSVERCEVSSTWAGTAAYPDCFDVEVSSGEIQLRGQGRMGSLMVLHTEQGAGDLRTAQGLARWTFDDGRIGYGVTRYSDTLVDGLPAGMGH